MNLFELLFWAAVGWVVIEAARRAALQLWHNRRSSREFGLIDERRAYLRTISENERPPEPQARPTFSHAVCGTDHMPWEACPLAIPRAVGVQMVDVKRV